MKYTQPLIIALGASLMSPLAQAHTGHLTTGLLAGLEHPLTGLDHLTALVLSGLLIGRLVNGKRLALSGLVCALALGAAGGMLLGARTGVEGLILLSLPVLFIFQWAHQPGRLKMAVTVAGLFMIAHGWAHGVEIQGAAQGFMAGFLLTSVMVAGVSTWLGTKVCTGIRRAAETAHPVSQGSLSKTVQSPLA